MKAIVFEKYGPADVLHAATVETPSVGDEDLLIKISAVEVTKSDCEMREFNFPVKWFWLPLRLVMGISKPRRRVLGGYFSGVVEEVGKSVNKFNVGDAVFGCTGFSMGAYAEYISLSQNCTLVLKPENMTFCEASAVPLGGLNALHFMNRADIKKGDTVLINGAGGSIGSYALQIAKARGAIVTVVDSGIKLSMLKDLGADTVIDYQKENFYDQTTSYDVVFDMVASSSYSKGVAAVKDQGYYIMGNPRFSDMIRSIFTPMLTNKKVQVAFAGEKEEELLALKKMIEQGSLKTAIDSVHKPATIVDAHIKVETEQRIGCVVLSMED